MRDPAKKQLTQEKVLEIRAQYKRGVCSQRELGEKYGISRSTVGQIVRGETWRYLPSDEIEGLLHNLLERVEKLENIIQKTE